MRVTIDEQSRLVHVLKGGALLTLALPDAETREALEAAAWGLEVALTGASILVVNGHPVTLRETLEPREPRAASRR